MVTNLFKQWELDYPTFLDLPQILILKQIIVMLSDFIYSSMSINKGFNDDYKLLLPYYFELKSDTGHSGSDPDQNIWAFSEARATLKSEYFDFSDPNNIKLKNNEISQNKIFKLDDNRFNWLAISNTLESNNIPSLIPGDWTLANGEYGKYFTNFIINSTEIEQGINLFGNKESQLYSKFELYNELNKFSSNKFELEINIPLNNVNQLEISAIFGNGLYNLSLIKNDKSIININNIELFNETNESISYTIIKI